MTAAMLAVVVVVALVVVAYVMFALEVARWIGRAADAQTREDDDGT